MSQPADFEEFLLSIEGQPPEEQQELLLRYFAKEAVNIDGFNLAVLQHYFARKGDEAGDTLAEVSEGQLALRRIHSPQSPEA